jgi:hypothetical protein
MDLDSLEVFVFFEIVSKLTIMVDAQEWLLDFLRFYRGLGFFEEYLQLSDEDLADEITRTKALQGLDLNQEISREDYLILNYDQKRVWEVAFDSFDSFNFHRAKDIGYGGQLHEEIVNSWANISRGLFSPTGVKATWQSAEEPIKVEFILADRPHLLSLDPDLIMPGDETYYAYIISTLAKLAKSLEPYIKETDHYFTIWDLGCVAMVMLLTPQEKNTIRDIRSATFL